MLDMIEYEIKLNSTISGEKMKFKGYDLVSIRYVFGQHGSDVLVWMTMGKNGVIVNLLMEELKQKKVLAKKKA